MAKRHRKLLIDGRVQQLDCSDDYMDGHICEAYQIVLKVGECYYM